MTQRAGSRPAVVATASPVVRPFPYREARSFRHSARMSGPPLRWIAPSTPPPPSSDEFAALTMASTCSVVMSPVTSSIRTVLPLRPRLPTPGPWRGQPRDSPAMLREDHADAVGVPAWCAGHVGLAVVTDLTAFRPACYEAARR